MIKVVLWDIDGTLLNFEKAENYAIKRCFKMFGLGACTDEAVARYSAINRRMWEALERGEMTKPQILRGRFDEFFRSEGIDFEKTDVFNSEYQIRLGDKFFFCDNGLETVQRLKEKVKQYAVTNGTYTAQTRKLNKSGLIDIFDGVFISDTVGAEKPNAEFFQHVWSKIGQYRDDEVMIVGDSLTSDIKGGNNAGIICCWYNTTGKQRPHDLRIDYEIDDLAAVIDIVK